jgi:hypothetical protein
MAGKKESSTINVLIINKGETNVYVDLDGNYKTEDDIIVLGPKGTEKASLTEERIEALKVEKPNLVIRRLGA